MKANFSKLKLSVIASMFICATGVNAHTWVIIGTKTMSKDGENFTIKDNVYGTSKGIRTHTLNEGSYGFFRDMGAQEALDKFDNASTDVSWYNQAQISMGATDDATSIENMKKSFELIKRSNEIRAQEASIENRDIPALRVSHEAMAVAQLRTDYARIVQNHADWGNNPYIVGQTGYIAENLAWGDENNVGEAADMWYSEKVCITAPNSAECAKVKEQNISSDVTGHYRALVNIDHAFTVTGAAVSNISPNDNIYSLW